MKVYWRLRLEIQMYPKGSPHGSSEADSFCGVLWSPHDTIFATTSSHSGPELVLEAARQVVAEDHRRRKSTAECKLTWDSPMKVGHCDCRTVHVAQNG